MRDWMDFNGDGEVDAAEEYFDAEMLCSSREEHIALFGDAGDFGDDSEEDTGLEPDDYDRYDNDSDYADGVDDAMDEFGEDLFD